MPLDDTIYLFLIQVMNYGDWFIPGAVLAVMVRAAKDLLLM